MRSLTVKLTVAFLCIGLLGALLVAFFVNLGTQRAFDQFVVDQGRPSLAAELASAYETDKNWDGAETIFERYYGDQRGFDGRNGPPIVLVDGRGVVLVGSGRYQVGEQVSTYERSHGTPIMVDDVSVGWLVGAPDGRRPSPGSPEGDFFSRVSQAILFSAIGAAAVALVLGFLLAQTLTRPLRELTAATQVVAKGSLGGQVVVRSRDELGMLAASFNQMSHDLARASSSRRQMTADIAHDLRTPLSVILGYTEALRDNKLPPDQEIFDTLHIEAQHLQHLIDDLRTLSLTDAGELPLMLEPTEPHAIIERAVAAHRTNAQVKGITLEAHSDATLPLIAVDVERMAQVLGNLLSNALRFTPSGGTIAVSAEARGESVEVRVQDSGTGIAPDDLPFVFERFYRADAARQQGTGSSGLGLAIAKGIVEVHGGTISAESVLGQGTTFHILLPTSTALAV